eukprot:9498056-Pyramimonas_sp.AAC.1
MRSALRRVVSSGTVTTPLGAKQNHVVCRCLHALIQLVERGVCRQLTEAGAVMLRERDAA